MKISDFSDDDCVVICSMTNMPHVDNVTVQKCELCGADIWFAESTKSRIKEDNVSVYHLVCLNCASSDIPQAEFVKKFMMPNDRQLQEVSEKTGLPAEEIKKRLSDWLKSQKMAVNAPNN